MKTSIVNFVVRKYYDGLCIVNLIGTNYRQIPLKS
jgi:hypothetical protein